MRRTFTAIGAAMLLAVAGALHAAGFSLSPVGLSIAPNETSGAVYAQNSGDEPIVIQVRALAWTQADGRDQRVDTRDLIVNPAVFRLAPGERQLVRFASRSGAPKTTERAFRVVFTEVPPAAEASPSLFGARVVIAQDIPVYVQPVARATCTAEWHAERVDGSVRVQAFNRGDAHCRLLNVSFDAGDRTVHQRPYIVLLAQSRVELDMSTVPSGAASLRMSAEEGSNGAEKPITVDIALPPAR
jgi:fimbrial chaperone protein